MKLFIARNFWVGNFYKYFKNAFNSNKVIVASNHNELEENSLIRSLRLNQISPIRNFYLRKSLLKYNKELIKQCISFKPDIFLNYNESNLYPHTIEIIKHNCKCLMVSVVADNPWDSIRYKTDFPHSLRLYDFIFISDPIWNINLKKVAPKSKIYWHTLGFEPSVFFQPDSGTISQKDIENYRCDLSFTGSAYGNKAEGAYRADILSYLTDYDLRIWGNDNWPYRFQFHPKLNNSYKGNRLPYGELRKLYYLTKINLNLPAPQIFTGFQPRVFEIAACKGFQIADYRSSLRKLFNENELVTFKSIVELKDKVEYYLSHEDERIAITERLYNKIVKKYTWKNWAKQIIDTINHPDKFEEI